jgi:predicted transcriptional regulator
MIPETSEILRRRKQLGLTQQQLSRLTGINRTSITKLENGQDMLYSSVKKIFDCLLEIEAERDAAVKLGNLRLGDVCNSPVEYVQCDEPLNLVAAKFIERSFSQFPVRRGERIVGSITEAGINQAIMSDGPGRVVDYLVEDVMGAPFPLFDEALGVSSVMGLIHSCQAVLVARDGNVIGIVTNTDPYKKVFESRPWYNGSSKKIGS